MTSFDFAGLLSTLGGTISAQAAGGGRGMQQFLDGLNKREEARLNRNHDAAQQSRQRMFQLTRDRMQLDAAREERKASQDFTLSRDEAQRKHQDDVRADEQAFAKSQAQSGQAFTERRDNAQRAHEVVMATKQQIFELEKLEKTAENEIKLTELRARLQAEEALKERAFRALAQDKDIAARERAQSIDLTFRGAQSALDRAAAVMARADSARIAREAKEREFEWRSKENDLDRKSRERIENLRVEREDRKEKEADEKKLNLAATAQWGALTQGTEDQRRAAEDGLRAILGAEMGVPDGKGGIIFMEVDWSDPKTGVPLLARAIDKGGFSTQAAFKTAEERTAAEQDLVQMTGQSGTYKDAAAYLETKRQYQTSQRALTSLQQRAGEVGALIDTYSDSQLPLDESIAREEEIGNAIRSLATDFGAYKRDSSQFTGPGAGLENMLNTVQSSITGLGNGIERAQEKRAINATGSYSPTDPLRFVGFMPRYADLFSVLNNSESMKAAATKWDQDARVLADMTDEQAGFANLSPDEMDLRARLRERRNLKDNLSLLAINRDIQQAYQEGVDPEATRMGAMIEGVGKLDLPSKMLTMQRSAARARGIEAVLNFAKQQQRMSGLTMFSNEDQAAAALTEFGPKNEDGTPRAPQSQEEFQKFTQDVYSSPQGIENMADDIMGSLQLLSGLDLSEQVETKLKSVLKQTGLSNNGLVRGKLREALRQRVGDLGDNAITTNTEAVGEIHGYDYGLSDRIQSTALSSSLDLLDPDERDRFEENYATSVLGEVIDTQDRAAVIKQFIDETRAAYPGYRQTAPGIFDRPAVGGQAELLTDIGEQQRLKLRPEEANTLTDSASFADLHQLFMRVDPQYAQAMADPGLLTNRADMRQVLARQDGPGLKRQYEQSVGYKKGDQYTVNVFDKLDYMRSVNVAAIENTSAAERDMLGGVQKYLQSLTVPQALAAIASPGNRRTPTGFKFADMGVVLPDPTLQEDAAQAKLPTDPLALIDYEAEKRAISQALTELEEAQISPLVMYDLDPRRGESFGILSDTMITEEKNQLMLAQTALEGMRLARSSEVRQSVRSRMSQYVGKGDFDSMKTMAARLGSQLPLILGESQDMVALEVTPAKQLVAQMEAAETNSAGLGAMMKLLTVSTASAVQSELGLTMASATEKDTINSVLKAIRLDFGSMEDEIHMLNAHLGKLAESRGGLQYEVLPERLRNQIDKGEFDMLAVGKERDYDQRLMLAFRLWTANRNAR